MLLIAVTGPVGSGRSTLLANVAAEELARARRVVGFVVAAGAGESVSWIGEDAPAPVERFQPDGVVEWARALADAPAADLVVLDVAGAGPDWLAAWPNVERSAPAAVAVGVDEAGRDELERALGRRFDIVVDSAAPDAAGRLREACLARDDWARVGLYGAGAGGVEVTAGAALHAAHVPLRGHFLSTVQAVILAFAGDGLGRRSRVAGVAFVAAGLKALSPAGSRLRPMLAITMQGVLFTAATRLVGWNRMGLFAGGAAVGLWAGAQGILMQWLFVGSDLFRGYEVLAGWAADAGFGLPALATLVAAWAGGWALVAGAVTAWAWRRGSVGARIERALARVPAGALVASPARTWRDAAGGALRDLGRPSFWVPVVAVAGILLAAGSPAERAMWIGLRAFAVGLVLFALARRLDPRQAGAWLRRRGRWGPAEALERALLGRVEDRG